jgi:type I restriction enzyme, S subunit
VSRLDWRDKLPVGWEAKPLRSMVNYAFSSVDKVPANDEAPVRLCNYTDVYNNEFITLALEFMQATATEEEIAKFGLRVDDVAITKDSESWDDIGVPALVRQTADDLVCGYHLALLRPDKQQMDGAFLFRCLQAKPVRVQLELAANGVTRFGIPKSAIGAISLPVPPLQQQRAIADYLDRETARLDTLVALKEEVLSLLAEKSLALITRAVTRGLDPRAPLRDSGIPRLGEIPAHWDVVPLMWLTQPDRPIMYGIVLPGPDVDEGIPILKGGNVRSSRMNLASLARTTPEIEAPYSRARLRASDLVYSIRGSIGDCEVVPFELEGCNITQDVARVAPRSDVDAEWLRYALVCTPIREALAAGSLGAAVRGINIFDLKRVRIPTPPPGEQDLLVAHLARELASIDKLAQATQQTVALIKERRAALIDAAVTGQIDLESAA